MCWRGGEGTDNGTSESQIIVMITSYSELFYWYFNTTSQLVALNSKTQLTGAGGITSSSVGGGCLSQASWPERLLPKVRTLWHSAMSVALYLMIDRGDIRLAIDRRQLSGLTAGAWLW